MTYDADIPSEFTGAGEIPIRRIGIDEVEDFQFDEPVIIASIPSECKFYTLPVGTDAIVPYLLTRFGDCVVPASGPSESYETTGSSTQALPTLTEWYKQKVGRYLKDWHVNVHGEVFKTPSIFPDWLNAYFRSSPEDNPLLDFQFLYWGDRGTRTGYHEDVFGSFSWSYNLRGRKAWRFFVRRSDGDVHITACTQCPGEMVFVPSGCFHCVENLEDDTISINQNWFNKWNLVQVAAKLIADVVKVRSDLNEFGVVFDSVHEEVDRLETLVKCNNCLNIRTLLNVIEWNIDPLRNAEGLSARVVKSVRETVANLRASSIPQVESYADQIGRIIDRCIG